MGPTLWPYKPTTGTRSTKVDHDAPRFGHERDLDRVTNHYGTGNSWRARGGAHRGADADRDQRPKIGAEAGCRHGHSGGTTWLIRDQRPAFDRERTDRRRG
jgi:hypothetical protein